MAGGGNGGRVLASARAQFAGKRLPQGFDERRGFGSAQTEVEIERRDGEESAEGIQQGIVRRSSAAANESLMDFVERGVERGGEPRREAPGPAPALLPGAKSAIEKEAEDEVLGEVRGLADDVIDFAKLMRGKRGDQPVTNPRNDGGGVIGRERVRGHEENHNSPGDGRPPVAEDIFHEEPGYSMR